MADKSTVKLVKNIDWDKPLVIDNIRFTDEQIALQFHELKRFSSGKLSDTQIAEKIDQMLIREEVFNAIMENITSCYDINLVVEEIETVKENIKKNGMQIPNKELNEFARRLLIKKLVFNDLLKRYESELLVTDDEINKAVESYNSFVNDRVKKIDLSNENKNKEAQYNYVRNFIQEEKIIKFIIQKSKYTIDMKQIVKKRMKKS